MKIPILTYHASSVAGDVYLGNDHVALAEDLRMLLRDGWRVVPLSWVVEQRLGMANRDLAKCVAITCDDGCDLEVLDVDYPERGRQRSFLGCLEDARIDFPDSDSIFHITSFVIADPKARRLLDEKCLHSLGWMSENWWPEVSRIDLFSIECHGWDHNHDILDNDAPDGMSRGDFFQVNNEIRAAYEIDQALQYVNDRISPKKCRYFAYPYGHVPEFLSTHYFSGNSKRLGLEAAFGTVGEPLDMNSPQWNLPRYVCGHHWKSPDELQKILDGCR